MRPISSNLLSSFILARAWVRVFVIAGENAKCFVPSSCTTLYKNWALFIIVDQYSYFSRWSWYYCCHQPMWFHFCCVENHGNRNYCTCFPNRACFLLREIWLEGSEVKVLGVYHYILLYSSSFFPFACAGSLLLRVLQANFSIWK